MLALSGRLAEAEQAVNRIEELSPKSNYVFSGRYWIYLYSNRPRQALDALAQGDVVNTGLGMAWKTTALAQAGDLDGALAALEGALAKGYRDVTQLYGDPYLEPLRRDPRFARLLARHGIDPGAPPEGHSPARRR